MVYKTWWTIALLVVQTEFLSAQSWYPPISEEGALRETLYLNVARELTEMLGKPLNNYYHQPILNENGYIMTDEYFMTTGFRDITIKIDKKKKAIIQAETQLNMAYGFDDYKEPFFTAMKAMNKLTGVRPLSRRNIEGLFYVTRDYIIHLRYDSVEEPNDIQTNTYCLYIMVMLPKRLI